MDELGDPRSGGERPPRSGIRKRWAARRFLSLVLMADTLNRRSARGSALLAARPGTARTREAAGCAAGARVPRWAPAILAEARTLPATGGARRARGIASRARAPGPRRHVAARTRPPRARPSPLRPEVRNSSASSTLISPQARRTPAIASRFRRASLAGELLDLRRQAVHWRPARPSRDDEHGDGGEAGGPSASRCPASRASKPLRP